MFLIDQLIFALIKLWLIQNFRDTIINIFLKRTQTKSKLSVPLIPIISKQEQKFDVNIFKNSIKTGHLIYE